MKRRQILALMGAAGVAGCARISESRLNPFNWFGRSERVEPASRTVVVADPRPLVREVTFLALERTPGGAVLQVRGLPPRQGYWRAALLGPDRDAATLTYQFRAEPPLEPTRVSTPQSREIVAAEFVSDQTLAGIREIRVLGAASSRAVRR